MKAAEIEKWLEQNTRRCPVGRVTQEMCERLRARPQIKDATERDRLIRPLVCVDCKWWEYFPESREARMAA